MYHKASTVTCVWGGGLNKQLVGLSEYKYLRYIPYPMDNTTHLILRRGIYVYTIPTLPWVGIKRDNSS